MNRFQYGYFSRQTGLLLTLLCLVLAFATPKFSEITTKSRMTEAYLLASESKLRLHEFYLYSDRFPETEIEVQSVLSSQYRRPDFVESVVVDSTDQDNDVVVRVYLKADVVENDSGEPQFLYLAANRSERSGQGLEWHCGASGVAVDLLPSPCNG